MVDQIKKYGAIALGFAMLFGSIYGWMYAIYGLLYTPDENDKPEVSRYKFMQQTFTMTILAAIGGVVVLALRDVSDSTIDAVANVFLAGLLAGMPGFFFGVGNPETNQELQQRLRINAVLGLVLAIVVWAFAG